MRRLLLGLATVAVEALWLGAWLRWVAAAGLPGVSPPSLPLAVGVGIIAFGLARALLASGLGLGAIRAASVLAAAVATLAVARLRLYPGYGILDLAWLERFAGEVGGGFGHTSSALLLVVTTVYLWWRGTRLGVLDITPARARRTVNLALVALAALAVAVRFTRPVDLAPAILGVTACGLAALARLHEASAGYGGTALEFGPTWLVLLAAAVSLAVGLALIALSALSLDTAHVLATALEPLPVVLYRVLVLLVLGLFLMSAELVLRLFTTLYARFLALLGPVEPREAPGNQITAEIMNRLTPGPGAPEWLENVLRVVLACLVLWLVARWLARALRRYHDARQGELPAERESRLTLGRVAGDLAAALRGVASTARAVVAGMVPRRDGGVRAMYAGLLAAMARRGQARRSADTPWEYEPVPAAALPEVRDELAALTGAYVRVRYGDWVPDRPALGALRAAWRRVQRRAEDG